MLRVNCTLAFSDLIARPVLCQSICNEAQVGTKHALHEAPQLPTHEAWSDLPLGVVEPVHQGIELGYVLDRCTAHQAVDRSRAWRMNKLTAGPLYFSKTF